TLEREVRTAALDPLVLHVYALEGSLPLLSVASAIRTAARRDDVEGLADLAFLQSGGTVVEDDGREVSDARGQAEVVSKSPGRLQLVATVSEPTAIVVRESFAPGWSANVNGAATAVRRADGRHLAVRVPAGRSEVSMRYAPPHFRPGLLLAGLSLVIAAG